VDQEVSPSFEDGIIDIRLQCETATFGMKQTNSSLVFASQVSTIYFACYYRCLKAVKVTAPAEKRVMDRGSGVMKNHEAARLTRGHPAIRSRAAGAVLVLACAAYVSGQTESRQLVPMLEEQIQTPEVTAYQLRRFVLNRIAKLPAPASPGQWKAEAKQLRQRVLNEVVFHGWPKEWVDAAPRFEDTGSIPTGMGYRIRKLRYEIVPGFASTAILYEPEVMKGRVPAILNVNGHVGAPGKAVEYKQKRCINQALRGIIALNLEWLGCGELFQKGNEHAFGAHLDLAGANAVGLFYLAMRKGLDYLYQHPSVDQNRIGMTGLSGGGWQTIVLSALDERISAAVPVAGHASFLSRLERMTDIGDIEQNPTDMFASIDYAHLAAMRAPRPTLLMYNAEDNCCFRAAFVKRENFDSVLPFFRLYGREDSFIVIADGGRKTSSAEVSARVNRGEQVLALDLLFTGEMVPGPRVSGSVNLLATLGERALGIQAAQLIAAGQWMQTLSGQGKVRIEASGMRTQVIALTAAALEHGVFSEVLTRNGIASLRHLLTVPVEPRDAPELFCLDLYKRFDIDVLTKLAAPPSVGEHERAKP
jgi:dienelactone hydrolase